MRKSTLIVAASASGLLALGAFTGLWWHERQPVAEVPPLDPEPVVFDTNSLTARKQPFPLPPQRTAEPAVVTPSPARETQLADPGEAAEEVFGAFTAEVCACSTTNCIIAVNDRYTSKLVLAQGLDPARPEIKELLSEVQDCQEAVRAKEQPPILSREELVQQREMERQEIMQRRLGAGSPQP
jgi:hypothetical protein